MKKYLFIVSIFAIAFSSCLDEIYEKTYRNVPVYMSFDELRKPVSSGPPSVLSHPGKIYFKDGIIFINEEMKGIHIIDNTDPASPHKVGFIDIPGNMDMAIKGNTLYADSYVDMVAIDISDLGSPKEVSRIDDVFPYTLPPLADDKLPVDEIDRSKGVVTGWEVKLSSRKIDTHGFPVYRNGWSAAKNGYVALMAYAETAPGTAFGIGGSMARFGLNGDYLYAVDNYMIHVFDAGNAQKPVPESDQNLNGDTETMFIYDNNIFLGSRRGMLVYSLTNPRAPKYKASFAHIYSCDPVVVQGHVAYVTLRGGNVCGQTANRLDIYSLSENYDQATGAYSYDMTEPYGLAIDDEILFVCDGQKGLLVYDASDISVLGEKLIASFSDIKAYDVISFDNYLFLIGDDGFHQYDYSDIDNIHEISSILVESL